MKRELEWEGATNCILLFVLRLLLAVGLPSLAFGQTNQTGKIFGTVTDSSGATVVGANVTITSPAMIVPQSMKTDQQGAYHFELVPLGVYTLTVDQPGFNKFVRPNINVTAGFSAEIGVQLAVGQISQTVEVSAAGPVVDTTSTHIDTSISSNVLSDELPLTRTTKDFVSVAPGVTPTVPNLSGGDIPSASFTAYGLTGQTTMLIEGINTRKSSSSAEGDIDFPTLEEFQLIPTAGNAEVETPGLYMNAIVKSGGMIFTGGPNIPRRRTTWKAVTSLLTCAATELPATQASPTWRTWTRISAAALLRTGGGSLAGAMATLTTRRKSAS